MMETMIKLKKYPVYKDSGEFWLDKIPNHWEIRKLKHLFFEKKKVSNPNLNCGAISFGKVVAKDDEKIPIATKASYQEVLKEEFLVNPLNLNYDLISLRIALSDIDVVVSSGYIVLKNIVDINKSYFKWLLHRYDVAYMKLLGSGVRQTISFNHIANSILIFPPLSEQTAIANFLDEKTAKIDTAIAQKETLIVLLKERKQIIIQNAVTKGIDPTVPMKDSGIEWLGQIPAHWETSRSKWLFTIRTEKARPDDIQLSATQAYGVISQEEFMRKEGRRVTQITLHLDKRNHVEIDDFVISMRSFQGGLERAWETGCIRSSYVVLQPLPQINVDFFTYLFKSYPYIQALRATSNFIRDGQDMNFNNFSLVDLPLIPQSEQKAIASHIETQSAKIDQAISLQQQQIEKLKEYKAILINNAVTGKIKVG